MFGPNFARLQKLKLTYDPENFFRHNHANIPPLLAIEAQENPENASESNQQKDTEPWS